MNSNIKYIYNLPTVNVTSGILLLESQKDNLGALWLRYMNKLIAISLTSDEHFKIIGDAIKESGDLHLIERSYAKNLLGIGDKLSVVDIANNGIVEATALMSFEELADIYFNQNEFRLRRAIVDRFFIFLWSEDMLLYPIANKPQNYNRPSDWKVLAEASDIYELLDKRFSMQEVSVIKPYQKSAIFSVLSSTTWKGIGDPGEEDIAQMQDTVRNIEVKDKRRISYVSTILYELRLSLIDIGRFDILRPRDISEGREEFDRNQRFDFIDLDACPSLTDITQKARAYYDVLKVEGLARGTIDGDLSAVVNFIKYVEEYYPDREIDIKAVDDMFEPDNEVSLFSILSLDKDSAKQILNKIIKFLTYYELFSTKARKNVPKPKRKVSYLPYREAMPKEMIQHIVEIIKERPPLMRTKWDRKKADLSWWKHEVYPVYPMMMLFGYYIPVRGEQVRYLCRQKSFILKEDILDKIIINTDKNVNRKSLQELPCVWDDLQLFVPFLEWHKEYYKNLPLVKYHNDDNSPWEDVEPIFNTPQVLRPIAQSTHYAYHKKLLCQYQLEVMQKAKEEGKEHYPKVAWAKPGKEFFKTIEELNRCTVGRLSDIEIMYGLHALRVTGATRYLESGLGVNLVMQLTGHTSPETLLRIYTVLSLAEKKEKLKSAVKSIYFGNPDKLLKNTSDLIAGELVDAYESNKDDLETALKDNALFSINRKAPDGTNGAGYMSGIEIAKKHHPSNWFPMVHGICPAVKCPDGREHKCSLCPYLITGKLFIDGVTLKANQALAKFQRDSLLKEEEDKKGYKNQALAESLELTLEEILSWWDIIEKINKDLYSNEESDKGKIVEYKENSKSAFAFSELETELTYLANAYDAKMIGVEQDRVGLKILTIKAMKMANAKKDDESFNSIADNEVAAIDYLMSYYDGKIIDNKGFNRFIENIKKPISS